MDVDEVVVLAAQQALNTLRQGIRDALESCPNKPGLYAVYGPSDTWIQLGLNQFTRDTPLYVGKAEDSLIRRDMGTHFSTGRTGSSTLRRSFAALLREPLHLRAVPRNLEKPGYFANFSLEPTDDQRLSEWMSKHLQIAFWTAPPSCVLDKVETSVLAKLEPPLNLAKVSRPSIALRRARARMAHDARDWALAGGFSAR